MVGSIRYGRRVPFAELLTDQPTGVTANLQTVHSFTTSTSYLGKRMQTPAQKSLGMISCASNFVLEIELNKTTHPSCRNLKYKWIHFSNFLAASARADAEMKGIFKDQ